MSLVQAVNKFQRHPGEENVFARWQTTARRQLPAMPEQKRRVRYAPRPPVNGRWELTTTTERRYRFRTASLRKNSKHNSLAACFDGSFVRAVRRNARLVRGIAVRSRRSAGRFEETELCLIENHVYNLLNLSNSHITSFRCIPLSNLFFQ